MANLGENWCLRCDGLIKSDGGKLEAVVQSLAGKKLAKEVTEEFSGKIAVTSFYNRRSVCLCVCVCVTKFFG